MTTTIQKGAKIPILEVDQILIYRDGRGLNTFNDGDVLASHTWGDTRNIHVWASSSTEGGLGATAGGKTVFPAVSTSAWLKITYSSGGSNSTGYIPVFNDSLL